MDKTLVVSYILRLQSQRIGTVGKDFGQKTLDILAEYINCYPRTARVIVRVRDLCLRYSENPDDRNWIELQSVLNAFRVTPRIFWIEGVNKGRPGFAYVPTRMEKALHSSNGDFNAFEIARIKLPSMIVKLLECMQNGELDLLRKCEYCGLWMRARRRNIRFCAQPKRCKQQFHGKTPSGRAENAKRQRETYKRRKERDSATRAAAAKNIPAQVNGG